MKGTGGCHPAPVSERGSVSHWAELQSIPFSAAQPNMVDKTSFFGRHGNTYIYVPNLIGEPADVAPQSEAALKLCTSPARAAPNTEPAGSAACRLREGGVRAVRLRSGAAGPVLLCCDLLHWVRLAHMCALSGNASVSHASNTEDF